MTEQQAERAVVALELIALRLGQIVQAIAASDAEDNPPDSSVAVPSAPEGTWPTVPRTMDDAPIQS